MKYPQNRIFFFTFNGEKLWYVSLNTTYIKDKILKWGQIFSLVKFSHIKHNNLKAYINHCCDDEMISVNGFMQII